MTSPKSIVCLILAALFAGFVGGCEQSPQKHPNVLILFTDDQRFDTVHALGNDEIQTPSLDKLVAEGVSFTQAHIMGGYNGAVCAPSRARLLTGRHAFGIVRSGSYFRPDDVLMPEWFAQHGYQTFATGKWHHSRAAFAGAFSAGDNIFFGGMHWPQDGGHAHPLLNHFDPDGEYPEDRKFAAEKFSSEMYADAAIDFLARQKADDAPFFAYVSFTSPHDPRMAPEKFSQRYDPEQITLPANFMAEHPFDNGDLRLRDEQLLPWPRTPEAIRKEIAAYYAMITEVDAQIGRILEALEASGQKDNTIIVMAGDNGLAVGQHGLLGKQNLYNHSVRVPLIFAGPGLPKNTRRNQFAYLYDIFPTVSDLAGLPNPGTTQGLSLRSVIADQNAALRENAFFLYQNFQRGVQTRDGWKMIKYLIDDVETTQLFDLNNDPFETSNLAENPNFAAKRAEVQTVLAGEMRRLGDELDVTAPRWGKPEPRKLTAPHQAVGAAVELAAQPHSRYAASGAKALVDGELGQLKFRQGGWLGFEQDDLDVVIDLGEVKTIQKVAVSFLQNIPAWIFGPKQVTIEISADGQNYEPILAQSELASDAELEVQEFEIAQLDKQARFIRVRAENVGVCPDWHPGAGSKAWLFVDEVRVD
ncbi:MAG: sulfatase-like hydrolase/transferase [Deferribacteres bacterium]|nr:sulfatase-like hydrolase/transferase [Deferribacteres bacterium]